ncbi:MAG: phage tail sheath family protein [Leptolyngbyaceae cyanobacterium RU_5_1]|nr:phage tail sheath family protein [Leptolyngbyaceae cyanobacterium RU_5_1]
MPTAYRTPGVYREEVFLQPQSQLPTGVPGFVGFAEAIAPLDAAQRLIVLNRKQDFAAQLRSPDWSYLADAVSGFFENGGTRCYVVRLAPVNTAEERGTVLQTADLLKPLEPLTDLDLVAIPDAMTLFPDANAMLQVQRAMLQHCGQLGNRMAILDAIPALLDGQPQPTPESVRSQRDQLAVGQQEPLNGALYYPWIKTLSSRIVPPCGHVAGVIARSDRTRGVFKAPANEELMDVLDLVGAIDHSTQNQLNPEGINCLRSFPGRGIRVWGARTLSRDLNWRYINVRRLVLTLGRWIDRNLLWATFEPNSPRLWVRIQRELSTYLEGLWRIGALQGQVPEQAFYVKCDAETNPPESRETGTVITEIGLAAGVPTEFLVIRITHRVGTVEVT